MYCNSCYKWTPSDDNREIDLPVSCNTWSDWTTSYNRENDSRVYCNPSSIICIVTEQLHTTEKTTYLSIATPDLTEQIHTTEKTTYLFIAIPDMSEQLHTVEKTIYLCIATPNMTEKHPSTTPEKWAYLCVPFPWYDWRTSQYNTREVSVPVCCLPLFPRGHCRSVSASRWPSRWSLHSGWQTN